MHFHIKHRAIALIDHPNAGRILKRIIIGSLIADAIILPGMLLKLFVVEKFAPIANASEASIPVGPDTQRLIERLSAEMHAPVGLKQMTRAPLDVPGVTIAIGRDSLQAFEYPDHDAAIADANGFLLAYSERRYAAAKRPLHAYADDRLIILYVGTDEAILRSLATHSTAIGR